jgi:hypothetical protein
MIVQNGANPEVRTSTCTFTAVGGLSATVNLIGTRRCNDGLLPAIPGCPP